MTGKALGNLTSAQFRRGIEVQLPADYEVDLLEVRK